MILNDIFTEVHNDFINGNYLVTNSTNRNEILNNSPPKMETTEALKEVVNYLIWEWCHDNNDQLFNTLIKEINIPPTDYDLSKFTFTELLEVVCPEILKTSDIAVEKPKPLKRPKETQEPQAIGSVLDSMMDGFDI